MSEEEKQAIEELKVICYRYSKIIDTYNDDDVKDYIATALNLIYKQQKAIEELKQITQQYEVYEQNNLPEDTIMFVNKPYFLNGWYKRNYISADKIKAKIKELEKEIEEKQEYGCDFTLMHEHEIDTNAIIRVLEELLEEGE